MALPMPPLSAPPLSLHNYEVLSFDIYGTLIEYKAQILESFQPLLSRLPADSKYLNSEPLFTSIAGSASIGAVEFLKLFQRQEDAIKLEKPVRRFDKILCEIWRRVARELNVTSSEDEAVAFGSEENIKRWKTFDGTIEALHVLSERYKLVALSNIDRYAWSITAPSSMLGEVQWWKVFTAEDFGDDVQNADIAKLKALVEFVTQAGIKREGILHVAQSLGHDHAPAKKLGLSSVFLIGDGPIWGKEAESKMALEKELVGYGWRCKNLQEFANLVTHD